MDADMMAAVLSLMVLSALALAGGGVLLLRRGGARLQAVLMFVLAAVIAGNVAIWVWPGESGAPPVSRLPG